MEYKPDMLKFSFCLIPFYHLKILIQIPIICFKQSCIFYFFDFEVFAVDYFFT